ncbi:ABC transporter substrate-binding protein [Streptomyces sp. TP-A0874]|uniref:ABC transporter substrate-binding protein n=1 Tax=Streptomyces sp. TP-A0874 TaxID=549819 RepID=UPI00099FC059|nr:ABC transporter substrate-binding protein [Streptomyces sp. TP-A0874]
MRSRLSRVAAAVAAAGLLLSACGGSGGGAEGDTVKLGAILPLTGSFATYGKPLQQAAELAVERVNAAGGITVDGKAHKVELAVYDDGTAYAKNIPQVFSQAVLREQVPFLITAWSTYNVAPLLKANPVPTVDVLAATWQPSVTDLDDHIFLLRPFTPDIIPGVPAYMKKNYKADRIAYIGPNEQFADGQLASLKAAAEKSGGKVVSATRYPADATDLSSFVRKALASRPEAIHVGGSTQAVAPLLTQLHQAGNKVPISMYTGMTPDQARDLIGPGLYNEVMANVHEFEGVTPQTNPTAPARKFGEDFQERYDLYGIDLIQWSYDAVWIAKTAMEKANTVTDREKITAALRDLTVPEKTVTGWIEHDGGKLFNKQRQATSLSVALSWDTERKTWAPAYYYTAGLPDQEVEQVDVAPPAASGD